MNRATRWMCGLALAGTTWAGTAQAGGGPRNIVVVVNADLADAIALADHYMEARSIPSTARCELSGEELAGTTIAFADADRLVTAPVAGCVARQTDPDAIDYLVLVKGLPYRVDLPDGGYHTSLDALLQISDTAHESGDLLAGRSSQATFQRIENPWFPHDSAPEAGDYTLSNPTQAAYTAAPWWTRAAELPPTFRRLEGATRNRWVMEDSVFVVTRIDGFDFDDAHALIDRAVAADGTFPTAELLFMEAADVPRGPRDPEAEYTSRMLAGAGFDATFLAPHDPALSGREVAAYFTGAAQIRDAVDGQSYVPGAIVDNVTSYGAVPQNWVCDGDVCPAEESQTSIARFVRAGATGVHGTVAEPFNPVFPNAGTVLLYTAGYNLGESFFLNQRYLYWQNLLVGDPLTTPYAERPEFSAAQSGTNAVRFVATHPDGIRRLDVYREGRLVGSAEGPELELGLLPSEPLLLDFFVVAEADDGVLDRLGWPEAAPTVRARTQGWANLQVRRTGPPFDAVGVEDTACSAAAGSGALWMLPLLALRRRPTRAAP